jgi:hypothetical protein
MNRTEHCNLMHHIPRADNRNIFDVIDDYVSVPFLGVWLFL